MAKRKSNAKEDLFDIEDLSNEEEYEENGICEYPMSGTPLAQFNFTDGFVPSDEPMLQDPAAAAETDQPEKITPPVAFTSTTFAPMDEIKDNRTMRSNPYGVTPPIDGESFDTRRTFLFRKSTIRALNELKAAHPDINIYLCSIVDKALRQYHDFIFKENGSQD